MARSMVTVKELLTPLVREGGEDRKVFSWEASHYSLPSSLDTVLSEGARACKRKEDSMIQLP